MNEGREIEILVVEDSPTQAELLSYLLKKHGYSVSNAINGIEAIETVRKHKPDLVISDIVMPEMDGYQLCKFIKTDKDLKDIIVILLSILSDPKDVIKGLESGADNFIIKPFNEQLLLSRISQVMEDHRDEEGMKKGKEILIAEDSPTQAEVLKHMVEMYGYRAVTAPNGREALDIRSNLYGLLPKSDKTDYKQRQQRQRGRFYLKLPLRVDRRDSAYYHDIFPFFLIIPIITGRSQAAAIGFPHHIIQKGNNRENTMTERLCSQIN